MSTPMDVRTTSPDHLRFYLCRRCLALHGELSAAQSHASTALLNPVSMRCSVKRGGLPEGGLRSENAGKPLAGEEIKMQDLGIEKEQLAAAKKPGRPKKETASKKEKS